MKQIQDDDPESVDVFTIGPPTGRQDSDLENEVDKILKITGLPQEIAEEVEVFNLRNNGIERMTCDSEDSNVVPRPVKKQKQNAPKFNIKVKWQKQHIQTQTFTSFDPDKNAQGVFLENPEVVKLMTSFEKVVSPLIQLLLHETNQYVSGVKSKQQFKVTLDELKNSAGLIVLSGYNIRLAEQDY